MKLCELADLEGTGAYGAEFSGQVYLVIKNPADAKPRVFKNACPHLGIALEVREHEFFDMNGEYIICANHGALFQVEDGLCIAGPCKNQSLTPVPFKVEQTGVYLAE